MTNIEPQNQKAQRTQKLQLFKSIIFIMLTTKLRQKEEKTYKEKKRVITADFLSETRQVRRQWNDIIKALKERN